MDLALTIGTAELSVFGGATASVWMECGGEVCVAEGCRGSGGVVVASAAADRAGTIGVGAVAVVAVVEREEGVEGTVRSGRAGSTVGVVAFDEVDLGSVTVGVEGTVGVSTFDGVDGVGEVGEGGEVSEVGEVGEVGVEVGGEVGEVGEDDEIDEAAVGEVVEVKGEAVDGVPVDTTGVCPGDGAILALVSTMGTTLLLAGTGSSAADFVVVVVAPNGEPTLSLATSGFVVSVLFTGPVSGLLGVSATVDLRTVLFLRITL